MTDRPPDTSGKPRRPFPTIPLVIGLGVTALILVLLFGTLFARGSAPALDQAGQPVVADDGTSPTSGDGYDAGGYVEPDRK